MTAMTVVVVTLSLCGYVSFGLFACVQAYYSRFLFVHPATSPLEMYNTALFRASVKRVKSQQSPTPLLPRRL
jgi:hypothetical protein